ncbi:hypothetical protein SE17_23345, partial [Kouleothrix aurantiaca]
LTQWLEDVAYVGLRTRTADYYKSLLKRYVIPAIGKVTLKDLNHQHVQRMINGLPKTLSPRSVRNIRAVLRRALNNALTWRLVTYNAATGIAMPKVEKYQARIPTEAEALAFRAAIAGTRLEPLYLIAMFLGLRRGELLGLLKEDIDLDRQELHVTGPVQLIRGKIERVTLKTEASRRTLPIPDVLLPAIIRALADQPDNPLLFPSEVGTPILPRNLVRHFKETLTRAELPDTIRLHDLRHFAATTLLANGADISTAQAVLGHADASITLNFYAHAMPNRTKNVVNDVVNKVFGEQPEPKKRTRKPKAR